LLSSSPACPNSRLQLAHPRHRGSFGWWPSYRSNSSWPQHTLPSHAVPLTAPCHMALLNLPVQPERAPFVFAYGLSAAGNRALPHPSHSVSTVGWMDGWMDGWSNLAQPIVQLVSSANFKRGQEDHSKGDRKEQELTHTRPRIRSAFRGPWAPGSLGGTSIAFLPPSP
jgi:hypothetical protein